MLNATFDDPDLTTFARLEELGLVVVGREAHCRAGGAGVPARRGGSVVQGLRSAVDLAGLHHQVSGA